MFVTIQFNLGKHSILEEWDERLKTASRRLGQTPFGLPVVNVILADFPASCDKEERAMDDSKKDRERTNTLQTAVGLIQQASEMLF